MLIFAIIPLSLPVSIPHRYAKNFKREQGEQELNQVSIPHRYAKNGHQLSRFKDGSTVSIPHRYAKNFSSLRQHLQWWLRFNHS